MGLCAACGAEVFSDIVALLLIPAPSPVSAIGTTSVILATNGSTPERTTSYKCIGKIPNPTLTAIMINRGRRSTVEIASCA